MLKKLDIQNYAIIAALTLEPASGMVIITGETGAGKSILLGALGLALGDRADSAQLRDKEKKTIIEATFVVQETAALEKLLQDADIDSDTEILLRREIQANGKSRAFVNDTPVALNQLQLIAGHLVDLHQQFDTLELGSRHFQRTLLDARAGAVGLMADYTRQYDRYTNLNKKIQEARARLLKANQESEYKSFVLQELQGLKWTVGEGKLISEELKVLSHAEQLKSGIGKAVYAFQEGDQPIISQLRSLLSQLQPQAAYHPALPPLVARFDAAYVELKDIATELESLLDSVQVDDLRMEQLNERLAMAQRIAKKHGLSEVDDLPLVERQFAEELVVFEDAASALQVLEKEMETVQQQALTLAKALHEKRLNEIPMLEKATMALLVRVGMPNAQLKIDLKTTGLSAGGTDEVVFLFDANRSGQFEPLHKVASGGELSRLMLVLKSLVAHSLDMPTLIFDEIDSGISGEAARQVGLLMQELSAHHQVIAITHQPQIAALASQHLYIYKTASQEQVTTQMRELTGEERVSAIARMMAGDKPSEAVLATAREMLMPGGKKR
ncbi:MAG: repair protein RecN [Bacteroidota bacterium]|jgi:DNA repair protein RecN (Recombination protein N)